LCFFFTLYDLKYFGGGGGGVRLVYSTSVDNSNRDNVTLIMYN